MPKLSLQEPVIQVKNEDFDNPKTYGAFVDLARVLRVTFNRIADAINFLYTDESITTNLLADNAVTAAKLLPGQFGGAYVKLVDSKATTINGGASIAGTQIRALNTKVTDTGNHCTLASNQFTLAAGTYRIKASVPAYRTDQHKAILYNVSDSVNELIGSSAYSSNLGSVYSVSEISGELTIATSKTFRIGHYTTTIHPTNGLGLSTSDGTAEIYTVVELWKVK